MEYTHLTLHHPLYIPSKHPQMCSQTHHLVTKRKYMLGSRTAASKLSFALQLHFT
jgi:hypothetical protein